MSVASGREWPAVRVSSRARALRWRMREDTMYDLFLLNVVLQLFDGMATYTGVRMGVPEGNQLLCNAFAVWGVGRSLFLFKGFACAVLLLLYRHTREETGQPAFILLAAIYCMFSLIPWLIKLIALTLPIL